MNQLKRVRQNHCHIVSNCIFQWSPTLPYKSDVAHLIKHFKPIFLSLFQLTAYVYWQVVWRPTALRKMSIGAQTTKQQRITTFKPQKQFWYDSYWESNNLLSKFKMLLRKCSTRVDEGFRFLQCSILVCFTIQPK